MYDMYPWDGAAEGPGARVPGAREPRAREPKPRNEAAIAAVQVALDRRDNGGDPEAEAADSAAVMAHK